jgi:hypothetical protein
MDHDLRLRVLLRAAEIAGGAGELGRRIGEGEHSLRFWLNGRAHIPQQAFLKAVDVVLADDLARAAQDRRAAPRQPEAVENQRQEISYSS